MAVASLKLAETSGAAMDRKIEPNLWTKWPLGVRVGAAIAGTVALIFTVLALILGECKAPLL